MLTSYRFFCVCAKTCLKRSWWSQVLQETKTHWAFIPTCTVSKAVRVYSLYSKVHVHQSGTRINSLRAQFHTRQVVGTRQPNLFISNIAKKGRWTILMDSRLTMMILQIVRIREKDRDLLSIQCKIRNVMWQNNALLSFLPPCKRILIVVKSSYQGLGFRRITHKSQRMDYVPSLSSSRWEP